VTAINVDLSVLGTEDLEALRLGAQVLSHRADLEGRSRVATFFSALGRGADEALTRRSRSDGAWTGALTIVLDQRADSPGEELEDHRLLTQYLDLLGNNPQLSVGVRAICGSIRGRLLGHAD
jgi:hypothetical protein